LGKNALPREREEARRKGHEKEAGIRVAERKIEGRNRNESSDLKGKKRRKREKIGGNKNGAGACESDPLF
jgi:hypothetical protein